METTENKGTEILVNTIQYLDKYRNTLLAMYKHAVHIEEYCGNVIVIYPENRSWSDVIGEGIDFRYLINSVHNYNEAYSQYSVNQLKKHLKNDGCVYLPVLAEKHIYDHLYEPKKLFTEQINGRLVVVGYIYMTPQDIEDQGWCKQRCKSEMKKYIELYNKYKNEELCRVSIISSKKRSKEYGDFRHFNYFIDKNNKSEIEQAITDTKNVISAEQY